MKKYSHDRELAAYMANSYINGEEITLKGIGKAVLFGGIYGTIGGILGVTQAPKSAKAVYSAFAGLAEGIRTAKETPGTIIEKSFAGLKNGLITAAVTFGGAYSDVNISSAARAMFDTTVSSIKAGVTGFIGSVLVNYADRKMNKVKIDKTNIWRRKAEQYTKTILGFRRALGYE